MSESKSSVLVSPTLPHIEKHYCSLRFCIYIPLSGISSYKSCTEIKFPCLVPARFRSQVCHQCMHLSSTRVFENKKINRRYRWACSLLANHLYLNEKSPTDKRNHASTVHASIAYRPQVSLNEKIGRNHLCSPAKDSSRSSPSTRLRRLTTMTLRRRRRRTKRRRNIL